MTLKNLFVLALPLLFSLAACQKNDSPNDLKLDIDAKFLARHDSLEHSQSLDGNSVTLLTSKLIPFDSTLTDFSFIAEFQKIDKLKKSGKYQQYTDNLDIGMTADASAFVIDSITINNEKALLWAIKNSSYEACPYYEGMDVFLTTFKANRVYKTGIIASTSHFSDPPVAFESLMTAKIQGNNILLKYHDKNLEMPEDKDEFEVLEARNVNFKLDTQKWTYMKVK